MNNQDIESMENRYLKKFYHFLKFAEDKIMIGFRTKEKIKDDWYGLYSSDILDFDAGIKRVIYSLLNGNGIVQPNSSPIGADLFFEVEDAFIHIDLKTVEADGNLGDYIKNIFVGTNQNSYKSEIKKADGESFEPMRFYDPSLPTFYNKSKDSQKICLTYFITVLYSKENLDILNINILSMPNGELETHYKHRPLRAGKNLDKTRFNFNEVSKFELLENQPSRVKVVYFNKDMREDFRTKLSFFENLYLKLED